MSDILTATQIAYEYPGKRALDDVSFSLKEGSITALVGPNGAGKTTLLRLIAALDTPFSGTITIDGLDTQEMPRECHAKIGYLSDSFGLYDDLSVRQCLLHTASMHHIRGDACIKRVTAISAECGLEGLLDVRAGSLSRGQRQRVGIAQALIHEPKLVLLDEPAAGLDPEARHELSSLVLALRDKGYTLLISSHILAELEDYSDSMLTLHGGRIVGHVTVGRNETASSSLTIRIQVLGEWGAAQAVLSQHSAVASVTFDEKENALFAEVAGDENTIAALLQELVRNEVRVVHFSEHRIGMQQVYLSQVGKKGAS
jgi:ABC-2 type transport system ATP-binding protein